MLVRKGRLIHLFAAHQLRCLSEDPRISDSPSSDHHSVDTRFRQTSEGFFRSDDVTAAYDWNRNRLLHRSDDVPISASAVALHTSAAVDRDHVSAAVFNESRYFGRIDCRIVPARTDLHRHRDRYSFANPAQNLFELWQVTKERRTTPTVDYFLGWGSAVDIYDICGALLDYFCGCHHPVVIVAEYLNRKRSFFRQELHHSVGPHIPARYSLNRNELGDDQADTVEFLDQPAERRIGDSGHRCKHQVWPYCDTTNRYLVCHGKDKV